MNVSYSIKGPLFTKKIDTTVQKAIGEQVLAKTAERVGRKGRRPGRKNNPITSKQTTLILDMTSPLNPPRTSGRAWLGFVMSLVKGSFMKNQLRAATQKIVSELN